MVRALAYGPLDNMGCRNERKRRFGPRQNPRNIPSSSKRGQAPVSPHRAGGNVKGLLADQRKGK